MFQQSILLKLSYVFLLDVLRTFFWSFCFSCFVSNSFDFLLVFFVFDDTLTRGVFCFFLVAFYRIRTNMFSPLFSDYSPFQDIYPSNSLDDLMFAPRPAIQSYGMHHISLFCLASWSMTHFRLYWFRCCRSMSCLWNRNAKQSQSSAFQL